MKKITLVIAILLLSACTANSTPVTITPIEVVPTTTATATDLPTATAIVEPTSTPIPTQIPYTVKLTGVDLVYLKQIYKLGQEQGRDPRRFSKVGDCQSYWPEYLQSIDSGDYDLGQYGYLEAVVTRFNGSYEHVGQAVQLGNYVTVILDPFWADPRVCDKGESPLDCEYRTYKPSIALIFVESRLVSGDWKKTYHDGLTVIVKASLDRGIIPVLSTQYMYKDHAEFIAETNQIIETVAREQNIPLWDFGSSVADMPDGGDDGNWHLSRYPENSNTDFSDPKSFEYGTPTRNLESLEILDILWRTVMS